MSKVIKLGNYKGIEAEVTKQPVADTEVDNEIRTFSCSKYKSNRKRW